MRILMSGATGLIGSSLRRHFAIPGWQVMNLSRKAAHPAIGGESIAWNPYAARPELVCDPKKLEAYDALIHLAGAGIADARWTASRKRELYDSRVIATRNLVRIVAGLKVPPKVLLCASAIGFYGDRGQEVLTEASGPGSGFLSDVCQHWEWETQRTSAAGIRVVNLRFGIVLSAAGGALKKMLLPFRLGLGGRLGRGGQYMSWVAIADVCRVIEHSLDNKSIQGPVNVTAPNPVTNEEFTRVLAHALHRPALLPVPKLGLQMLFGELSEALLSSVRVVPDRLVAAGFEFRYPVLLGALEPLLACKTDEAASRQS